ncbi:hypothetical protein [Mycobacterium kubicae]|uniref:hypothetical protein n=1 Tax=Mycobacterium kubicae TaxID=120959 RepID=UPI000A660314|nr:hypothetical protein [Mycobacterium kubicae]
MNTIGHISNTRHNLYGDVQNYPDDEDYQPDEADRRNGFGADWRHSEGEWVWPADRRWRPAAAVIGAIVAVGAIATAVIINSGDSASTKATVAPHPVITTRSTSQPSPSATLSPSAAPTTSRAAQPPPETITTLTPPPSTARTPTAVPPRTVPPPSAGLNPQTVVYSVTGDKQLFDLINVVYTDARGFPVTEFNVALPWTKVVVLNPGVKTESVVATSLYGRLNCAIANAQGQLVKASTNNAIIATCTR